MISSQTTFSAQVDMVLSRHNCEVRGESCEAEIFIKSAYLVVSLHLCDVIVTEICQYFAVSSFIIVMSDVLALGISLGVVENPSPETFKVNTSLIPHIPDPPTLMVER